MPGLKDIVREEKEVHGQTVVGLSSKQVGQIFSMFPTLAQMTTRGTALSQIFQIAPHAVSAIIINGTRSEYNEENLKVVDEMIVEHQLDIVEAIFKLTFPGGVGPFAQRLRDWHDSVTQSQGVPGKMPGMKSPLQPPASPDADTGESTNS